MESFTFFHSRCPSPSFFPSPSDFLFQSILYPFLTFPLSIPHSLPFYLCFFLCLSLPPISLYYLNALYFQLDFYFSLQPFTYALSFFSPPPTSHFSSFPSLLYTYKYFYLLDIVSSDDTKWKGR